MSREIFGAAISAYMVVVRLSAHAWKCRKEMQGCLHPHNFLGGKGELFVKRVLALDFDGLLCSALTESVLATWNGYYDRSLTDFCDAGLDVIPPEFIERFILCRNFAKHPGHFFTALLNPFPPIQNQEDFEAAYQSIPPEDVHRFIEKVSRYRALVRQEKLQTWLGYHQLYPGIAHFLRTLTLPTYIVTAKDAASIAAVLGQADVPFEPDHIIGDQRAKIDALQSIQQREEIKATDLFFFDDNVLNVLEAKRAAYSAFWALWGYNAPDHFTLAQRQHIATIDLPTFLTNNPVFSHPPFLMMKSEAGVGKNAGEESKSEVANFLSRFE